MKSLALIHGEMKPVKNLGWLIRHWKNVKSFKVKRYKGEEKYIEALLYVYDQQGILIYQTDFSSLEVLWNWLDRPVFRGVSLVWNGLVTKCGDKEVGKLLETIMQDNSKPGDWFFAVQYLKDMKKNQHTI